MTLPVRPLVSLPNLGLLHAALARNDGTLTVAEQLELQYAVALIGAIDWRPDHGLWCTVCGTRDIPPPTRTPLAPAVCLECSAYRGLVLHVGMESDKVWNTGFYRAEGHLYSVSDEGTPGPTMTVRLFSGHVLVTQRLQYQGPIPERWRAGLVDNCFVVAGNPGGFPYGWSAV